MGIELEKDCFILLILFLFAFSTILSFILLSHFFKIPECLPDCHSYFCLHFQFLGVGLIPGTFNFILFFIANIILEN